MRNPWSWYPVVATKDLERGTLAPVVLNGERLVVWRSAAGRASAWSDRCPHRGMRLSFGAVHQETLICPYHGWTFADDAYCVRIPAHPGVAPSRAARARVYPTAEADGYVWVCLGEPSTAAPSAQPGYRAVRTLHFSHPLEDVVAAFMTIPLQLETGRAVSLPTEIEWTRKADGPSVAERTIASSAALWAEFEAPGMIVCEARRDGENFSYFIRLQPTESGSCAVHAAWPGSDSLSFNRALIRFRNDLQQPEIASRLRDMRHKLHELMPVHLAGLIQGEAP
nr:Rieske (2Fe-2S) protein [Bradyrhizobium sp. dw_78]